MKQYKITVIGLGLIGGSMAVDLKRRGFASRVMGVEADPVNAAAALKIGLVDQAVSYDRCLEDTDLVILAVPVGEAVRMLPEILDRIGSEKQDSGMKRHMTVIDVCSTKSALVRSVENHPCRDRYVSTHPMAGTEYSGPWAAMSGMFDGKACVICDGEKSGKDALETVENLYDVLNMRTIRMNAINHDMHAAYVSHISHVTSFALALTVLKKERSDRHIFDLASGGFSSTVRLAKSNADMWVPILTQNRDNILDVIDTYMDEMKAFRDAIASGDGDGIRGLIGEANRIKRIIK
ncbi:MAG: prephenate dehydrogenase [Bacteroidetes bacterium]|uniref:Prephenate dehydrogenase n=1 Tax=Candidatus Cryptobacteroides faecipullorum TaxID=2840764 RepID=A0A9D9I9E0_9BACT|nr:prephenate dehydrogenase [Candidatus Cryptobacteroides faecipullorum]